MGSSSKANIHGLVVLALVVSSHYVLCRLWSQFCDDANVFQLLTGSKAYHEQVPSYLVLAIVFVGPFILGKEYIELIFHYVHYSENSEKLLNISSFCMNLKLVIKLILRNFLMSLRYKKISTLWKEQVSWREKPVKKIFLKELMWTLLVICLIQINLKNNWWD